MRTNETSGRADVRTCGRVDGRVDRPATVGAAVMPDRGLPLLVMGHSPWNADDSGPSLRGPLFTHNDTFSLNF